ncbi:MAG: nuclear transport factor 2 family protein, partial [Microcoleus sp. SIO2G3]|nr:nuclear transport factor 2 family protein [Microcoleus sp. SIO2G3]
MKEMAIETLEESLRQAMLNSDVSALDDLIADDLVFTLPSGLVIDKQTDLEAHRTGIQKYNQIETNDMQIHHHGDWAVVTLKAKITAKVFSGTYCFTRIWAKRHDRWQI